MSVPESIPEDREQSYMCECGGNITLHGQLWECDKCDASFFEAKAELI